MRTPGPKPPTLLIFGGSGQIGMACQTAAAGEDWPTSAPLRASLDICDAAAVAAAVAKARPAVVINAAAYTAVDKAESEPDLAFAVNREAAGIIAAACAASRSPLIHLSTDYVFDGRKQSAYRPTDPVNPTSTYGRSKAAGEDAVRSTCPGHVILRTAWVFSAVRQNFVKTMLRLGRTRDSLRIVADQRGCPSGAPQLGRDIVTIARRLAENSLEDKSVEGFWGTYHLCGEEAVSWYEFAGEIFRMTESLTGRPGPRLEPIASADYPTAAARPANSVLDSSATQRRFGLAPMDWRADLRAVVRSLVPDEEGLRA